MSDPTPINEILEVSPPLLARLLYPYLASSKWGYVDLDTECRKTDGGMINPKKCSDWIESLHRSNGLDYTFGGYLENRSCIWSGAYQEEGAFWHLGIDFFNVPADAPVHLPVGGFCVYSNYSDDHHFGWGGRTIFLAKPDTFFIIGHLKQKGLIQQGQWYEAGTVVGEVASYPENGNWYAHTHFQVFRANVVRWAKGDYSKIDGYSKWYADIQQDYPIRCGLFRDHFTYDNSPYRV